MASRAIRSMPKKASAGAERCSVLGTLAVVGDFWTLGVLRCAVYGMRRFGEFERELGIATNVLSDRLARLVEAGVLERTRYQQSPPRDEYVLTDVGLELMPVILALKAWGDRHRQEEGPWTAVRHRGCGSALQVVPRCPDCGAVVGIEEIETVPVRHAAG
jgi:DNA-binding HxlR family transcriptional regulator